MSFEKFLESYKEKGIKIIPISKNKLFGKVFYGK